MNLFVPKALRQFRGVLGTLVMISPALFVCAALLSLI